MNSKIKQNPYQNNNSENFPQYFAVVILVRILLDFGVHNFDKSPNIEEKSFYPKNFRESMSMLELES